MRIIDKEPEPIIPVQELDIKVEVLGYLALYINSYIVRINDVYYAKIIMRPETDVLILIEGITWNAANDCYQKKNSLSKSVCWPKHFKILKLDCIEDIVICCCDEMQWSADVCECQEICSIKCDKCGYTPHRVNYSVRKRVYCDKHYASLQISKCSSCSYRFGPNEIDYAKIECSWCQRCTSCCGARKKTCGNIDCDNTVCIACCKNTFVEGYCYCKGCLSVNQYFECLNHLSVNKFNPKVLKGIKEIEDSSSHSDRNLN